MTAAEVKGIENLRNVKQSDGSLLQRFTLVTSNAGLPESIFATLVSNPNGAKSLKLVGEKEIYVETPATKHELSHSMTGVDSGIEQLRRLTRGNQ